MAPRCVGAAVRGAARARCVRGLVGTMMGLALLASPVHAADAAFEFDQPRQPLGDALKRYAVVTDQTVVFSDALVAGRTAPALRGTLPADEALRALLAGTGLVAERPGGRADAGFVLRSALVEGMASAERLDRGYDGLVQTRVVQALCGQASTMPGRYTALLRLRVDAVGRLTAVQMLGSTGDVHRDRAMLAVLRGLPLGAPPPPDLQQPLTLAILPPAANDPAYVCAPENGR